MDLEAREALYERANALYIAVSDGKSPELMGDLHAIGPELGPALEEEPDAPCERYARACYTYTRILRETGKDDQTPRYYEACRRFAERTRTRTMATLALGRYWLDNRCYERGLEYVLSLDTSGWAPQMVIHTKSLIASFYNELGSYEESRSASNVGLQLSREQGFGQEEAMFLHEIGVSHYFEGSYERALPFLDECVHVSTSRFRSSPFALSALQTMACCLVAMKRVDAAEICLIRARELSDAIPDVRMKFHTAHLELVVLTAQARWGQVLERHDAILEEFGDHVLSHPRAGMSLPHALASVFARAQDPVVLKVVIEEARHQPSRDEVFTARLGLWVTAMEDAPPAFEPNVYVSAQAYDALVRVRAGEAAPEGEWSGLEEELLRAARGVPVASCLRVRGEFEAVSLDGVEWVELTRKHTGRAFLRALAESWPLSVDSWVLHDRLWPGARVEDTTALNRLYAVVYRLRACGLEDALVSTADGYRLAAKPVRVEDVEGASAGSIGAVSGEG